MMTQAQAANCLEEACYISENPHGSVLYRWRFGNGYGVAAARTASGRWDATVVRYDNECLNSNYAVLHQHDLTPGRPIGIDLLGLLCWKASRLEAAGVTPAKVAA